jgi:hypothetical protein
MLTTDTGDVALDPFAGSGVVLAQSAALRRRFVGLDLRKTYRSMFLSRVLPSISEVELSNARANNSRKIEKREFGRLIWSLRKTKYPRELIRLYEAVHGQFPASRIMAMSRGVNKLRLVVLCNTPVVSKRRLELRLKELGKFPPLSKYGLFVEIAICLPNRKTGRFLKLSKKDYTLAIYSKTNTHHYARLIRMSEFVGPRNKIANAGKASEVQIASNVHLRVPLRP